MSTASHSHVFLGEGHDKNERRTWAVIALCAVMMVAEIVGGFLCLHLPSSEGALGQSNDALRLEMLFGQGAD